MEIEELMSTFIMGEELKRVEQEDCCLFWHPQKGVVSCCGEMENETAQTSFTFTTPIQICK